MLLSTLQQMYQTKGRKQGCSSSLAFFPSILLLLPTSSTQPVHVRLWQWCGRVSGGDDQQPEEQEKQSITQEIPHYLLFSAS